MQRIAERSDKLKEGLTSNLVECFFSVNNKFINGKVKNII